MRRSRAGRRVRTVARALAITLVATSVLGLLSLVYGPTGRVQADGVVTSGLLLHLDSARTASYSGSGSTWSDLSGNGRHATLWGNPPLANSTPGTSRVFNFNSGSNNVLSSSNSGHNATLGTQSFGSFAAGITVQATVNFGTTAGHGWERIFDFGNGAPNENILWTRNSTTNNLELAFYQGTNYVGRCFAPIIDDNQLRNYAISYSSGGCAIYENGVAQTGVTFDAYQAPNNTSRSTTLIGRSNWVADAYLESQIRSLYIYNRALTAEEIAQNYNAEQDFTAPTVTVTRSGSSTLKVGDTTTVTFTLSESSTNFVAGDVTVSGGTLSSFSGSGTSYTATFTPTANASGTASISVAAGAFTDAVGNSNTTNSLSISYDTIRPSVSSMTSPTVAAGASATVTITLSEASSDFAFADLSATGGTLSSFASSSSTSYTVTFTPAGTVAGTGTVTVAAGSFSDAAGNTNASASSGNLTITNTLTSSGGRTTFTGNGSIGSNNTRYIVESFTSTGTTSWTAPQGVTTVDVLVVAGGGGGGSGSWAGGGGAGGVVHATSLSVSGTLSVTVGAGGAGGDGTVASANTTCAESHAGKGRNGSNSVFGSLTAVGGGGGGGYGWDNRRTCHDGRNGGNGGGAGEGNTVPTRATSTQATSGTSTSGSIVAYGNSGGSTTITSGVQAGSGGGGAGAVGGDATGFRIPGNGGAGRQFDITGSQLWYAGGGGGASCGTCSGGQVQAPNPAIGGSGVGGNGGNGGVGAAGMANRGGGGGGAQSGSGGAGGSGIVVVRYVMPGVSVPDLESVGTTNDTGTSNLSLIHISEPTSVQPVPPLSVSNIEVAVIYDNCTDAPTGADPVRVSV